jgi:hypothetical protein
VKELDEASFADFCNLLDRKIKKIKRDTEEIIPKMELLPV